MAKIRLIFGSVCFLLLFWKIESQLSPRRLPQVPRPNVAVPTISNDIINDAVTEATSLISSRRDIERNLVIQGRTLSARLHPAESRHQLFLMTFPRAIALERIKEQFEEITKVLADRFNLSPDEIIFGLSQLDLSQTTARPLLQQCLNQFQSRCESSRFRTFDGSCNNMRNPSWGMSFTCFRRILPPQYADGISKPRLSNNGKRLPPPRKVSLAIHSQKNRPAREYTLLVMSWGQFVDHDITLTPISRTVDNGMIQCCPLQNSTHPQCLPIVTSRDDPFYSKFNQNCINFVRSAMCPNCVLGPRQQTNQVSSFIDGSHMYGTNLNTSRSLRTNSGDGKLLTVMNREFGQLLPPSSNPDSDQCSIPEDNLLCFRSGDPRVNQQPGLTTLHTIMARQHNRIAEGLKNINPRWSGDRIYQETRKIIGAQLQMITWNEYLPVVLGPEYSNFYNIPISDMGYTTYDPSINPSLLHEFATAAYRFGHSLIDKEFQTVTASGRKSSIDLRDNFFFPFDLRTGLIEILLRGIPNQPAQSFDPNMVPDVTNFLYRRRGNNTGLDLASLNVLRGRDHGIPGYTAYLRHCFGLRIGNFNDLRVVMPQNYIKEFQNVYKSVDDIDLFSGGTAETPVKGGIIGPTFATIVGLQFNRLKFGDRYFFTHGSQTGSFSRQQLQEIFKTSLAKIICSNSQVNDIQENVFRFPSFSNPVLPCRNLPDIGLGAWRD